MHPGGEIIPRGGEKANSQRRIEITPPGSEITPPGSEITPPGSEITPPLGVMKPTREYIYNIYIKPPTNPTLPSISPHSVGSVGGLSKKSEEKQEQQKIYACLEKLAIQHKDKIRLSNSYSETIVAKSVTHCTRPNFKIQTTLDASIFYFCKNPGHITPAKEEIVFQKQKEINAKEEKIQARKDGAEEIRAFLWTYCQKILKNVCACPRTYNDYIIFRNERIGTEEKVFFSDDSFKIQVENLLRKLDLPIHESLSKIP